MKNFNYVLSIFSLLAVLMCPLTELETKFPSRHMASVPSEVKDHPKFTSMASQVDPKTIKRDDCVDPENFRFIKDELKTKLAKEVKEFKKDESDKNVVTEQRKKIEFLVKDLLTVEGGLKDLKEKESVDETQGKESLNMIVESKALIESLISELEKNEELVKDTSRPTPEKIESIVEVTKNKDLCEVENKNSTLSSQMEKLLQEQNQLIQTMISSMSQMMLSMQLSQINQFAVNGPGFQIQNPYQYNQPFTSGNWVYMPNGSQINQENIFSSPDQIKLQTQTPSAAQQSQGASGQTPQAQTGNNWNLLPQNYFDPSFDQQPLAVGTFGAEAFSFNMEPSLLGQDLIQTPTIFL